MTATQTNDNARHDMPAPFYITVQNNDNHPRVQEGLRLQITPDVGPVDGNLVVPELRRVLDVVAEDVATNRIELGPPCERDPLSHGEVVERGLRDGSVDVIEAHAQMHVELRRLDLFERSVIAERGPNLAP